MPRPRLLVVDDEETILFAMSRYLGSQGFEVDVASDLEAARAFVDGSGYAAVIADLRLTGHRGDEGLELVSYVHERHPGTRAVLLTAYSSPEIDATARSRGAAAVLRKPMALPDLVEVLRQMLG